MHSWIVALFIALVPASPWSGTYDATASAIEEEATLAPLYPGEDGVVQTVAELVAVAFFESHFDPAAVNHDTFGIDSIGLLQVSASNLRELRMAREELFDARTNIRAALRLLRASHRTCRGRPRADQLAAYATGRGICSAPAGLVASRNRMTLARALLAQHPPFWREPANAL